MRFFLDQDVYAVTMRFLSGLGHDIVTASALGLAREDDLTLLNKAKDLGRIFVTRDRDFGGLVFVSGAGAGVLYLRMTPSAVEAVHQELKVVLDQHRECDLKNAFVVIEPHRHRFRKIV